MLEETMESLSASEKSWTDEGIFEGVDGVMKGKYRLDTRLNGGEWETSLKLELTQAMKLQIMPDENEWPVLFKFGFEEARLKYLTEDPDGKKAEQAHKIAQELLSRGIDPVLVLDVISIASN
jgi:hypothetical protein